MGMDIVGRAIAARARGDAAAALSRMASIDLFANLPAQSIDNSIATIFSGGHTQVGVGGGTYVADSLANASLAAAHPRACKATANGRYFRLAGPTITVEQLGALGCASAASNSPNDQPAIQAALDYAAAVGLRAVQFTKPFYALWTSQRTHSDLNYANDGRLITIKSGITLEGIGPRPVLTRWGYNGVAPSDLLASVQVIGGNYWRGGGIWLSPDTNFSAARLTLRNFKLDGQLERNANDHAPIYPPGTLTGWDITDKGFSTQGAGAYAGGTTGLSRLDCYDVEICRFRGEVNHGGTNDGAYFLNCHYHTTGGDVNNWQGGYARFDSCKFGNGYSSSEDYCFSGRQMNNCEIYDCDQGGFSGGPDPTWDPAYYDLSRRQDGYAPWVYLNDLMIRNCAVFYIGSWVRGRIIATDTTIHARYTVGALQDIDLEIESWADQAIGGSRNGFLLEGPPSLTTQISGKPVGTYFERPRNINVRLVARRTKRAADAGITLPALFAFGGYMDADSCHFTAGPSVVNYQTASYGTQFTMPFIRHDNIWGGVRGVQGTDVISANTTISPVRADYNLDPNAAGPFDITMGTAVEIAHEQEVTFWFSEFGTEGRRVRFAPAGNLKIPYNLVLSRKGEYVRLRFAKFIGGSGAWALVDSNIHRMTGSKAYDAPSIANGAQTTTTVTVAGALLGDVVEAVVLGASAGGLVVNGYVSAADTVTVVLSNTSGAAVDLPATTLSVEVAKR